MDKSIDMLVACTNANGEPDLVRCKVCVTEQQYESGDHYEKAKELAKSESYEAPFICYDDIDQKNIFRVIREILNERTRDKLEMRRSLELERELVAQEILENADFGVEGDAEMSGWEICDNQWSRKLFFESPNDGNSILKRIIIDFLSGTNFVNEVTIDRG